MRKQLFQLPPRVQYSPQPAADEPFFVCAVCGKPYTDPLHGSESDTRRWSTHEYTPTDREVEQMSQ